MKPTNTSSTSWESKLATAIAVLTLLITIVVAIPGFMALNKDHPDVFYSVSKSEIVIPESLDKQKVSRTLSDNGVPTGNLIVSLINQGNIAANEVKVAVRAPGEIIVVDTNPNISEKPIWVDIPKIAVSSKSQSETFVFQNLVSGKKLVLSVGYQKDAQATSSVSVVYDGKEATIASEITTIPKWSPWKVFIPPLLIVLGGIGLIFLVAIFFGIRKHWDTIKELYEVLNESARLVKSVNNNIRNLLNVL